MDKEERAIFREVFSNACMIYVTEGDDFVLGSGIHAVTGACRHYDRTLIFTGSDTWMTRGSFSNESTPEIVPINTTFGCTDTQAVGVLGNSPLTVQDNKVLLWSSQTDERDECNARVISSPVKEFLSRKETDGIAMFVYQDKQEVWLYRPASEERILVWQDTVKAWTSFDGFVPETLFVFDGQLGFSQGDAVFLFDGTRTSDVLSDGTEQGIRCVYEGQYFDFGTPRAKGNVCRGVVIADCGADELQLTLESDKGHRSLITMQGERSPVSVMMRRAYVGRFRQLRAGVIAQGKGTLRLYGIKIAVKR